MSISSRKRKRGGNSDLSEEFQRCLKVLTRIQAHPDAVLFLEPVDWKELGLLDYPKVVKKPMDLGTVESKLLSGQYKDISAFAKDVRLIWSNTMSYNQEDSEIYKTAESFDDMFTRNFKEVEAFIEKKKAEEEPSPSPPKKKAAISKTKSEKKSEKKPEKKSRSPHGKSDTPQYKQCVDLIDFFKSKEEFGLFLDPVDWEGAGLFSYPEIVKHPMDIGTIEGKLKSKQYKNLDAFASDFELVWKNAMAFNLEDSEIYENAKKMKELFQKKWKRVTKSKSTEENKTKKGKQRLCDLLRGLSSNQKLGELVLMVQKHCPVAMEMNKNQEIVIRVGKLDASIVSKLVKHIDPQLTE